MSMRSSIQTKAESSFTPVQTGLLQRKCGTCGQHLLADEKCAECEKKRSTLQQRATNQSEPKDFSPVAYNVLGWPDQLLNAETRAPVKARFDYDSSTVSANSRASAQRFLQRQTSGSAPTKTSTTPSKTMY